MQTTIVQQLDTLLKQQLKLSALLDDAKYEEFQHQQDIFSDKIKALLDSHSSETLSTVIDQLKILEKQIATLQKKSEQHFKELKEQSLLQKRNKNKIKAYK